MRHHHRSLLLVWRILGLPLLLSLALVCGGCSGKWEAQIEKPDGSSYIVNASVLRDLEQYADGESGLQLERLLWNSGHSVIDTLIVDRPDAGIIEVDWPGEAEDARWLKDGSLSIGSEQLYAASLDGAVLRVEAPTLLAEAEASITDISTTAAHALGLPAPSEAEGRVLDVTTTNHVLLLFLDGFGYVRYQEALEEGLIPELAELVQPSVGLTVYPPCTRVASGALLTGAHPEVSGVTTRSDRKTDIQTLFDVASEAGVEAIAVEGESISFNLRNVQLQLSGDRDGNGSTDDNVLANAMSVLNDGMPDLFYVHFHGIDDAGHEYGPGAPQEEDAIRFEDAAVGQILDAVPESTMVIIFADHGMHWVNEEGKAGNHGNLIARDMFIPIFVHVK